MWRCFLGAVASSTNIASIADLKGSSRGEILCGVFRGGGTGELKARLTVFRDTWYLRASSRVDSSPTLASLRIPANNSTLDPILVLPW